MATEIWRTDMLHFPDSQSTENARQFQEQVYAPTDPHYGIITRVKEIVYENMSHVISFDETRGHYVIIACGQIEENVKKNALFATFFGRDAGETGNGIERAKRLGAPLGEVGKKFRDAIVSMDMYQIKEDDHRLGRKRGMILHEVRTGKDIELYQSLGLYYNEAEDRIESPDAADATHWWVVNMTNIIRDEPNILREKRASILMAADYILSNSTEHHGLAGFTNKIGYAGENGVIEKLTDEHGKVLRDSGGVTNQTWMDSWDGLMYNANENIPHTKRIPQPGQRVDLQETTALKYVAEMQLADRLTDEATSLQENKLTEDLLEDEKRFYEEVVSQNLKYAQTLRQDGERTKQLFNQPGTGFIRYMPNGLKRFIEAIGTNQLTGVREQLPGVSVDIAFALNVPYIKINESGLEELDYVISDENMSAAIETAQELFIENVGVANFSQEWPISESTTQYHRYQRVLWLDKGAMLASGLIQLGLKQGDEDLIKSGLLMGDKTAEAILEFGSCLELYVVRENIKRERWKNPLDNHILILEKKAQKHKNEEEMEADQQEGCHIQAWVVGKMAEYLALRDTLKGKYAPEVLLPHTRHDKVTIVNAV